MKTYKSAKSDMTVSELQFIGYIIRLLGCNWREKKIYSGIKLSTDDILDELKKIFIISKEDLIIILEKMHGADLGILFKETIHNDKIYWGFEWLNLM